MNYKFRHHISFTASITGAEVLNTSFDADHQIPFQSEGDRCVREYMEENYKYEVECNDDYIFVIQNLSTFRLAND